MCDECKVRIAVACCSAFSRVSCSREAFLPITRRGALQSRCMLWGLLTSFYCVQLSNRRDALFDTYSRISDKNIRLHVRSFTNFPKLFFVCPLDSDSDVGMRQKRLSVTPKLSSNKTSYLRRFIYLFMYLFFVRHRE